MAYRLLQLGFAALALIALTPGPAPAQGSMGPEAERAIHDAIALSARIRGYHRWQGLSPLPPGYCETMAAGEAVLQELARLANRAISYRLIGFAQRLEKAADLLGDQLDEEEMINVQAGFSFTEFPCPTPTSAYSARASVLPPIVRTAPLCSRQGDIRLLSFNARRVFMAECLRLY